MSHPFAAAIAARDAEAIDELLAPDVVLHSPLTGVPFEGRELVGDVFRSVFESFEEVHVVDELESGDTYAFFWEGRLDGVDVAGADRVRMNSDGQVREVTIMARPIYGSAAFLSGTGPRFARRRRGGLVARVVRITGFPLPRLLRLLIDPVTGWLMRGRSRG